MMGKMVLLAALGLSIVIVVAAYVGWAYLLRHLANCDEREDAFADPDPKPVKRRAF